MRNFFKKIHLYLSLPVGLLLSIICLTGAILVFDTEILELCYPERYFVESDQSERLPLDQLIPLVNRQLDTNSVKFVKIPSDPNRAYEMLLNKGFRNVAFVNPYNAQITGIYEYREGFFFKVMSIHRWLLDSTHTWGRNIVGMATLIFVVIVLSGMMIWIPKSRKKLKKRLTVNASKGKKRLLHDLHVVIGIYVSLILLVSAITGPMWSFDWYRNGVFRVLGSEVKEKKKSDKDKKTKDLSDMNIAFWQAAINNLPADSYVHAIISESKIEVLPKNAIHTKVIDSYLFDENSGEIKKVELYDNQNFSSKIMGWTYVLHTGKYGGLPIKIITFVASLLGATLPLTGYYMYFSKKRKKKKRRKSK